MNWYKLSQTEEQVQVASECGEGVAVYIGNKRYWCPGRYPNDLARLNALIRARAWGKAKQLLRNWPCHREDLKNDPQGKLW